MMAFCCSGCMQESYKEFRVDKIYDCSKENYFVDEAFDFARIENVVFIPEIKKVNHEEYRVYISAYCKTESKKINILNVCLKANEKIIFDEKKMIIYIKKRIMKEFSNHR